MIGGKVAILAGGAVAALAALMFSGKNASAAPGGAPLVGSGSGPQPVPGTPLVPGQPQLGVVPPSDILSAVAQATASGDPAKIRATADDVEKRGFPSIAADLRVLATEIQNAMLGAVIPPAALPAIIPGAPPAPPNAPPVVIPPGLLNLPNVLQQVPGLPQIPQAPISPAPGVPNPALSLAQRMALMLSTATRGKEDKALVTAFQAQEKQRGAYSGALDGIYGPGTALALAQDFGIVPPKPLYWPKNPAPAKASYTAALLAHAGTDAPRAEEWSKASDVKFSGEVYDSRRHGPQQPARRSA